jgi:hypothetical protein
VNDESDLVDEHFRPFVRALGNLVITFALAEAATLELVGEMLGGDELKAVALLKSQDAKEEVLSLVDDTGLQGYDLEELRQAVVNFWSDKEERNRLIHDEWFPNIYEKNVATRGITRKKNPEVIFNTPEVKGVWELALRFQSYDDLFSHRAYVIRRAEGRTV